MMRTMGGTASVAKSAESMKGQLSPEALVAVNGALDELRGYGAQLTGEQRAEIMGLQKDGTTKKSITVRGGIEYFVTRTGSESYVVHGPEGVHAEVGRHEVAEA